MKSGFQLYEKFSESQLETITLQEKIKSLHDIQSITIIGSSWSGKTTIRNILADIVHENPQLRVSFPKRVITREQRPNDNLEENEFAANFDVLKMLVGGGLIWQRDLGEKSEYYGFKLPDANTIPVYSANNALIRGKGKLIQEPLQYKPDTNLILLVHVPDRERLERNQKREGNYLADKPKQKQVRLEDTALSMMSESHILVRNDNFVDKKQQRYELFNIVKTITSI